MNSGDLSKVWEVRILKRKPKEEEAKKILERVAEQVQPIMRKRNWRVKLLSEFCPRNLLGLNVRAGVHVKLRLRRPNRDEEFLPFNEILDTMLHELCHNVHGPHNASFYQLWDELRKECEELMNKGISGTGEGFDLTGRRLGGFSPQPPISALKQTALAAAEKRKQLGSLMPPGPKRVGGDCSLKAALSPTQAAAMAAERRLVDNIWCGSEFCDASEEDESHDIPYLNCVNEVDTRENSTHCSDDGVKPSNESFRKRKHGSDSKSEQILVDLDDDSVSVSSSVMSRRRAESVERQSHTWLSNSYPESQFVVSSSNASAATSMRNNNATCEIESTMWECLICTLLNPPLALICELCSTLKPKDVHCKYKVWSCKFCTLDNNIKLDKCAACGEWRYSRGPPVSTAAPHLDT